MPKEQKSPKLEVERRVDLCLRQMIDGWIPYRIAQYVAKMKEMREEGLIDEEGYREEWDWGVEQRQVYEYCARATEELEKALAQKRVGYFNLSLARWNELLRKAILAKDLGNARLIQKEIDRLTRVDEFGADTGDAPKSPTAFKLPDGTIIDL